MAGENDILLVNHDWIDEAELDDRLCDLIDLLLGVLERMGVGENTTTSLALVLHELATNSLKYGALSAGSGTLDITTASKGSQLELTWMERGGPKVKEPPEASGFGSKLVHRSVSKQLGGKIEYCLLYTSPSPRDS